jgi:hypothetical protein
MLGKILGINYQKFHKAAEDPSCMGISQSRSSETDEDMALPYLFRRYKIIIPVQYLPAARLEHFGVSRKGLA